MKQKEPEETRSTLPKLSKEHQAFAEGYLRCLNRTDAYLKAYPKVTRESARREGSRLLTNVDIASYVETRMAELTMKPAEILRRMSDMAQADLKPFIRITTEGFVYFDFSHPDAMDHLHLIKRIESKRTRRVEGHGDLAQEWEDEWVKVELHDAKDALEKLGRQHKLFRDNVDITSDGKALQPSVMTPSQIAAAVASLQAAKGSDGNSE